MNPHVIKHIAWLFVALLLLLFALNGTISIVTSLLENPGWYVAIWFIPIAVYLACAWAFYAASHREAKRYDDTDRAADGQQAFMEAALAVLGVALMVWSLPSFVQVAVAIPYWEEYARLYGSFPRFLVTLSEPMARFLIGAWLFFGRNGIHRVWRICREGRQG